ncbi:MAG: peptide chain release factor 2 [Myxococcales bacterium]|nr:MAG: peptide chain release factor 2 [Myxococcales bacterium]
MFDLESKRRRLAECVQLLEREEYWSDPEKSKPVQREKKTLEQLVGEFDALLRRQGDIDAIFELGDPELAAELGANLEALDEGLRELEIRLLLAGDVDPLNAIISINSGAGGTESQDWSEMLLRMYLRYAEKQGYETQIVDILPGEEAGVKNVTFVVSGLHAYGYLKAEQGVHRLVRISPFDAAKRRHTSFSSVSVTPEIDDSIDIEINEADLRIDTYRSSGAGGQHVNTTDSAVRITHLPSGIVVACQNERSQHKNRHTAMKLLRSKMYEMELEKRRKEAEKNQASKMEISFGSQIRSYVLAPYRLVKDHRTDHETSNVDAVLDGDLVPFIKEYLMSRVGS